MPTNRAQWEPIQREVARFCRTISIRLRPRQRAPIEAIYTNNCFSLASAAFFRGLQRAEGMSPALAGIAVGALVAVASARVLQTFARQIPSMTMSG